jgi:hypothetical protein
MNERCRNKNVKNYHRYGGRGIKVCERWKDFENFILDMGEKPFKGASIDRIDNNGNYEPSNCRWTDQKTQINNREKTDKYYYELNGIKYTLNQLCKLYGIKYNALYQRLVMYKFPVEKAIKKHSVKTWEVNGKFYSISELSALCNIPKTVLNGRLNKMKWPIIEAITKPISHIGRPKHV